MAIVFAPAGVGLVVGSVIMPRILQRISKERAIFIGSLVIAVTIALLPLSTLLAHYLEKQGISSKPIFFGAVPLLMFIAGIAIDFINIPAQTAIQESYTRMDQGTSSGLTTHALQCFLHTHSAFHWSHCRCIWYRQGNLSTFCFYSLFRILGQVL